MVEITAYVKFNMNKDFNFSGLNEDSYYTSGTTTEADLQLPPKSNGITPIIHLLGDSFTYDDAHGHNPQSGHITGFDVFGSGFGVTAQVFGLTGLNITVADAHTAAVDSTFAQSLIEAQFSGADIFHGSSGKDTFNGYAGADTIDGGAGADSMYGGSGADTYYVDDAGDSVFEDNVVGIDTVISSVSFKLGSQYIENVTLVEGAGAINATGNSLANVLTGNSDANVLNGSTGADTMAGGAGADTYYVDNVGDRVIEGNVTGVDTVLSSISFKLGSQYIENLTLTGTAHIDATGNSLANILTGNSGNNVLNGSTGADTMAGGAGNDTYYVDNAGDRITEGNVIGVDTVNSSVSFSLGSQYIENVTLTGTAGINATGNSLANVLVGNSGANLLNGSTGLDTMTGGAGADKFWFSTAASAANVDHITDFSVADDTIQISRSVFSAITGTGVLTADQFVGNATGTATTTSQHVIYNTSTGELFYDTNGSDSGGSTLFAVIDNHATAGTLTNADFLIV